MIRRCCESGGTGIMISLSLPPDSSLKVAPVPSEFSKLTMLVK